MKNVVTLRLDETKKQLYKIVQIAKFNYVRIYEKSSSWLHWRWIWFKNL